ncbi:hypothetical protein DAI22_02g254750 [Oryza sativa Japonica Group]|nr:hypothetical protein DAI22_02g254750 [Oryza sativa Japonica Group]
MVPYFHNFNTPTKIYPCPSAIYSKICQAHIRSTIFQRDHDTDTGPEPAVFRLLVPCCDVTACISHVKVGILYQVVMIELLCPGHKSGPQFSSPVVMGRSS